MTLLSWHHLSRRLSGWLLAALLLATLAPAVSRALAAGPPQDGQDWVELCTAQGMQWVLASELSGDSAAGPDGERTGALDLCGHCTLAAERFAPCFRTGPRCPRWWRAGPHRSSSPPTSGPPRRPAPPRAARRFRADSPAGLSRLVGRGAPMHSAS